MNRLITLFISQRPNGLVAVPFRLASRRIAGHQSLAAIINGVRACSVELRAARPAGFLT
jgi:hypothetical protein